MKYLRTYLSSVGKWLHGHLPHILIAASIITFALSFSTLSYQMRLGAEVSRVQKSLRKRQKIIEQYSVKALFSDKEWVDFADLPDDMVLYCYSHDSLKSWTHQFPIINDDVKASSQSYRLQSTSDRNQYSTPLAYIDVKEQYLNLGSAWYIVNTQISPDFSKKVVSGILVRTDYPSDNLKNTVNPHLHLSKGFTTIGITYDDSAIVYGREGEPLFSIVTDAPSAYASSVSPLVWISFLLLVIAVLRIHFVRRRWNSFAVVVAALALVRVVSAIFVSSIEDPGELFSPIYYADNNLFNSLGNLLLNSVILSLTVYALFWMRHYIFRQFEGAKPGVRKAAAVGAASAAVFLVVYIWLTLRSLIINSNIVLEPFRLTEISFYSLLCYLSYAMLALALLEMLELLLFVLPHSRRRARLSSWRSFLVYVMLFSAFFVASISINGLRRESEANRVRTAKLAIERDLSLELALIDIDSQIENDAFVGVLSSVKAVDILRNRLMDRYFTGDIMQKYNIEMTVCSPDNLLDLKTGAEPVGCFQFYDDIFREKGSRLYEGSHFSFIDNYDGKTTYLGDFLFLDQNDNTVSRLFIELESKYQNATAGTALELFGMQAPKASYLPRIYSYAKYIGGKLVSHYGSYVYPVEPSSQYKTGYYMVKSQGWLHFVNKISEDDILVISRQRQPVFTYLISFSYLTIFFGLFLMLASRLGRPVRRFSLPKHSLRRKITFLLTGSMVVALLSMGVGSVVYVMKLNRENFREVTGEKIANVAGVLSQHCKYALRYNRIVTPEMVAAMEEVASVDNCDVILYAPDGRLIYSTNREIFEQFIVGYRMNGEAFRSICLDHSSEFTTVEKMAGTAFYALYAPLFNADGNMVAIVCVPYMTRSEDVTETAMSTLSTIINLYLVLLIAAVILGHVLSNSMSRPLAEIRKKIDRLALPGNSNRHIKYRDTNDELGVLINSYNKMVDDLEESTKRLAQQEREQAWKEMARQIAHEIKNPLTPMRLSIQYLMKLKESDVPGWEDKLDKISHSLLEQIDSLSNTASEFSSFSKFFSEEVSRVDLDEVIREQAVLFDNRDNISIRYLQNVENAYVEIRRSQFSRVIVNLMTNSVQAIENSGQEIGHIKITLDEGAFPDGRHCYELRIEDNGPGVSPENLSKLFTPNFTTKTGGTGLGLAICRSIIQQSQGTISYSQSSLGGACFTIKL